MKGLFIMCIFAAVTYFGWPIIEAILITLPIPDPKRTSATFGKWFSKAKSMLGGIMPSRLA
jgi:hypothetical protein